jgi:hypothetical protein
VARRGHDLTLFAIRGILKFSKRSIWISVCLAFLCGIVSVAFVLVIIDIVVGVFVSRIFGGEPDVIAIIERVLFHPLDVVRLLADPQIRWLIVPATFVHLWLPLLLLGALANSAINAFFRVTGAARWFLDKGDKHSLEAIGIMASLLVFVVTAIYKVVSVIV